MRLMSMLMEFIFIYFSYSHSVACISFVDLARSILILSPTPLGRMIWDISGFGLKGMEIMSLYSIQLKDLTRINLNHLMHYLEKNRWNNQPEICNISGNRSRRRQSHFIIMMSLNYRLCLKGPVNIMDNNLYL